MNMLTVMESLLYVADEGKISHALYAGFVKAFSWVNQGTLLCKVERQDPRPYTLFTTYVSFCKSFGVKMGDNISKHSLLT